MAAFRYHISRMYPLPLDPENKQKEWKIIQTMARNNFPQNVLQKLNQQIQHKIDHTQTGEKDIKIWTTFTYHSPKIRKITSLFKHTNKTINFRTTTTLYQLTKSTMPNQTPEHEKSGVYKLTCNKCHRSYIGQTKPAPKIKISRAYMLY